MNFVHYLEREFLDASPPLAFSTEKTPDELKCYQIRWLPPYQCRVRGSHPYWIQVDVQVQSLAIQKSSHAGRSKMKETKSEKKPIQM
jgi:hypothetical protein